MNAEGPAPRPPEYPADKVRQGEIILRTRTRRLIFIAGLAGIFVLALLTSFVAMINH
jgi:hypothetical protein